MTNKVDNSTEAIAEDVALKENPLENQPDQAPEAHDAPEDNEEANLHKNQRGATMLEWTLLLAAIALPSWFIIKMILSALVGHYRMMTTINGLPFP